jgi:hypothetical protein
MSLIIEDGTGVENADSYATLAELATYATSRGVTLSGNDAAKEVLLRQAADYLETLEHKYKGSRVDTDQALAWPRSDVYLYGSSTELPEDEIPALLIKAQCQLACDAQTLNLLPNGAGREVIRQKVDVIETEYAKQGTGSVKPELNKAMAILAPLLNTNGFAVQTVRV